MQFPNWTPSRDPTPPHPHAGLPPSLRLSWQPVPGSPRGGANPAPPHHFLPPPSLSLPPTPPARSLSAQTSTEAFMVP